MQKQVITAIRLGAGLIGLWLCISCQHKSIQEPLPIAFKLAGVYSIQAIQIEPALMSGTDLLALYDDSTGLSPCLRDALIQFDSDGLIKFRKPAGCESNSILSDLTQLQFGERWSLDGDQLITVDDMQTTQYTVSINGQIITLKLGIEQGYASSLDENDTGYTVSIELHRL